MGGYIKGVRYAKQPYGCVCFVSLGGEGLKN